MIIGVATHVCRSVSLCSFPVRTVHPSFLDSEGAVCSHANDGPGVACLSCHKFKKCCDWIAWNAAKAAEACSSMTNVVPGPSSVGETSSGTARGHKARPSVEALREISTEICAFRKSYKVGHKVDEERIARVERQARIMEQCTVVAIDSIHRLTAAILGDRTQALAPHHIPGAGMGEVEAAEDLEPWLDDSFMDDGEGESVGDELMEAMIEW